jgi:hypothetical protein
MDESLLPVTGGMLDIASLIADVIGDVRLTALHPEMPAPRKVTMILHMINEAFGPAPQLGLPTWIEPGTDADGVAAIVANWLRGHPEPFTRAVELFSGTGKSTATLKADGAPVLLPAQSMERRRLSVPPGEMLWWRTGWLVTDAGVIAAKTRLLLVPGRVPFMTELETSDVPFGTLAAAAGGLRRTARAAWPTPARSRAFPGGAKIESTALLVLHGETLPCGIAWEVTLPEFTGHVVRLAAGLPGGVLLGVRELAGQGGPPG